MGNNIGLHDRDPHHAHIAILLIDVINDFDFPEAEQLLRYARPMSRQIAKLKQLARQHQIPVVYVNDNFGKWRSDFKGQVDHCLRSENPGRSVVELLAPEESDYFVLKPKHSGFFSSALDLLLKHLGVETVVLAGLAANICVLFTANDAYMRDLRVVVPRDCVASNTKEDNDYALQQMQQVLKADIRALDELQLTEFY